MHRPCFTAFWREPRLALVGRGPSGFPAVFPADPARWPVRLMVRVWVGSSFDVSPGPRGPSMFHHRASDHSRAGNPPTYRRVGMIRIARFAAATRGASVPRPSWRYPESHWPASVSVTNGSCNMAMPHSPRPGESRPAPTSAISQDQPQFDHHSHGRRLPDGAADAVEDEAQGCHSRGVVQVAAVEDHRGAFSRRAHHLEVGVAELAPLGGDRQGVGLFKGSRRDGRGRSSRSP